MSCGLVAALMAPPKFLIPNNSLMALRMKQVRGAYEARDFVKTIV